MTENKTPTAHKGPAFTVQFAPKQEGAPWVRIGALWPTKSGKGYRLSLDFVPRGEGNILVLPFEPKDAAKGEGA